MKRSKTPKRLIRHVSRGDRVRFIGVRGKPVKRVLHTRKYIVEIRRKGKVVGYVNNVKKGKPERSEFSKSMLARLQYTRRVPLLSEPKKGGSYAITNKKRVKSQITKKMLTEIRKNKGTAAGFSINLPDGQRFLSPLVQDAGRLSDSDLRNLITSNFLSTLNSRWFRISPQLKTPVTTKEKRIKRLEAAQLQLVFASTRRPRGRKPKARTKRGK